MDEDKLLNELRAQRELIRKHLEWLDARISEQEGKEEHSSEISHSPVAAKVGAENKTSADSTDPPAKSTASKGDEDDEEYPAYKAATGDDVLRAKIGCLVLFVLSIALFLFLLFGLPYLLD